MNNRFKPLLKIAIWTLVSLVIIYIICFIIFMIGTHPLRQQSKNVSELALSKTPITKVEETYHMSQNKVSNSVKGIDKKGQTYYFVYLANSKKAYLYKANEGITENHVKALFDSKHPGHKNLKVEFGWYQNKPVWEISYKKHNGNYGYAIYSFKTGKQLFYVDNL